MMALRAAFVLQKNVFEHKGKVMDISKSFPFSGSEGCKKFSGQLFISQIPL